MLAQGEFPLCRSKEQQNVRRGLAPARAHEGAAIRVGCKTGELARLRDQRVSPRIHLLLAYFDQFRLVSRFEKVEDRLPVVRPVKLQYTSIRTLDASRLRPIQPPDQDCATRRPPSDQRPAGIRRYLHYRFRGFGQSLHRTRSEPDGLDSSAAAGGLDEKEGQAVGRGDNSAGQRRARERRVKPCSRRLSLWSAMIWSPSAYTTQRSSEVSAAERGSRAVALLIIRLSPVEKDNQRSSCRPGRDEATSAASLRLDMPPPGDTGIQVSCSGEVKRVIGYSAPGRGKGVFRRQRLAFPNGWATAAPGANAMKIPRHYPGTRLGSRLRIQSSIQRAAGFESCPFEAGLVW